MTYLEFLLLFLVVPLALLAVPAVRALRARPWNAAGLAALVVAAYVWTTPWDNYLVATSVWGYGPGRVLGTIWFVPVEEYAFFGLQALLTGGVTVLAMRRAGVLAPGAAVTRAPRAVPLGWAAAAVAAAGLTAFDPTRYLGLVLTWLAPPMALQWWYGGRWLAQRMRRLWPAIALVTLYLWAADAYAISNGIWTISARYTTGLAIGPLPVEEAVFFLGTNLLVAQGMVLFASTRQEAPAWSG